MNVENINKLIDRLESIKDFEYEQISCLHERGCPACVAGHAVILADNQENESAWYFVLGVAAKEYLEITREEADLMFKCYPFGRNVTHKKQDAINMLKNFLEAGKVVWMKENEC